MLARTDTDRIFANCLFSRTVDATDVVTVFELCETRSPFEIIWRHCRVRRPRLLISIASISVTSGVARIRRLGYKSAGQECGDRNPLQQARAPGGQLGKATVKVQTVSFYLTEDLAWNYLHGSSACALTDTTYWPH